MKKLLTIVLAIVLVASCVVLATACGKKPDYKIGVQAGTTGQLFLEGDEGMGFEKFTNIECKGYANGGLAVQDMINGNLDYVIIDEAPANTIAKANAANVKVINIKLTDEEYAFGVDKEQPQLLASVNQILIDIKANGEFDKIASKYFSGEGEITGFNASTTVDASKADKQLVVATNANFAPFEYKIGDKFAGVDLEIAKYIAEELEMELVIKDMEFDSVVTSVGKTNIDIAMAGLTVNEKRKASVNFSDTYYNASQVIIVKKNDVTFDSCTTAEEVIAILKTAKAK